MLDATCTPEKTLPVSRPRDLQRPGRRRQGTRRRGRPTAAATGELVLFANDGERLTLTATEDAHVILLSGEPIDEPIVQYGPFVMNTVAEIQQAIADVNRGKFGPVPE